MNIFAIDIHYFANCFKIKEYAKKIIIIENNFVMEERKV